MENGFGSFDLSPNSITAASILNGVTLEDIQELMDENSSLRGFLQGYLAERVLRRKLEDIEGVRNVTKIPDRDKKRGDFLVDYLGRPLTMEVKSVATRSVKKDVLNETWQGTVNVKNTDSRILEIDGLGQVSSSALVKDEFDILAICCFAVRGKWDFMFIESQYLPEPESLPGMIQTKFSINPMLTPGLTHDPVKVFDAVYRRKC